MSLMWEQVTIEATDPTGLGRWWAEALGWVVVDDDPPVLEIRPSEHEVPGILFFPATEAKSSKNRLHLDFRPDDQPTEVGRLLGLGATRVDIGQGDVPWVVLADPEGNEFCVLGGAT